MSSLIDALTNPGVYDHPVTRVEVVETHISWVLLAGEYAYKIKKPVSLPFVDFSSLSARRAYCEDEVRLNRRLAPRVYLGVISVTGSVDAPVVGGQGQALEYAVRMRRFEQDAVFDRLLERGEVSPDLIDTLAARIAEFHAEAPTTTADSDFGHPEQVLQPALDNFSGMAPYADAERRATLDELSAWTRETFEWLRSVFATRHEQGFVRECHGDLHLRNIALIDDQPVAFDCIEFNADFRWIDVIDEVAFLVMDLIDRGRRDLGYRFLDGYLQATGDYAGVAVLRFYLVYRAMVRAKIHDLRARQASDDKEEAGRLQAATDHYLGLARAIARGAHPALILMHGFSGSGKSRVAEGLVASFGAIRVRSDVERKRLFGLAAEDQSGSQVAAGLYGHDASAATYGRLSELADVALKAGYPTVVDAACLAHWQRDRLVGVAADCGAVFRIVDCEADVAALRERVAARAESGADPSEATGAVLDHQLATHEPFTGSEAGSVVACRMDGDEADSVGRCVDAVSRALSGI